MISLVVPSYTAGPNLQRTIDSCRDLCDETIVICTALYDEDRSEVEKMADKMVGLDWNFVFTNGFGSLYNQGSPHAKNNWLLLLGTSETVAERYGDIPAKLRESSANKVFRCCHVNDPNEWKRIWNRNGGTHWSGLIHEEIVGGQDGGLLFRMQDTDKIPESDPIRQEAFRLLKALSYHWQYHRLREDPSLLGGTNHGWLDFVKGSMEANVAFISSHQDLMDCCLNGDRDGFLSLVEERVLKVA